MPLAFEGIDGIQRGAEGMERQAAMLSAKAGEASPDARRSGFHPAAFLGRAHGKKKASKPGLREKERESLSLLPARFTPPASPIAKNFASQNGYDGTAPARIPHPLPPAKVIGVIVLPCVLLSPFHHLNSLKIKVVEARGVEPLFRQPLF